MDLHDPRVSLAFGILGNVVSFGVYLAPVPTFYRILKKKSTQGFQSIPYSVALFSAMLMLYYAFLKGNSTTLITINSAGVFIETIYLSLYLLYATHTSRVFTAKLLVFFNFGAYVLIVLSTFLLAHGSIRLHIVGYINVVFSVCVFAAPLSIMRLVIRTKSVEFMPFPLSLFLTLCAVCWLMYGLSLRDFFVATPNFLGLAFGLGQMILYLIYRNRRNEIILPETRSSPPEPTTGIADDDDQMMKLEDQNNADNANAIQLSQINVVVVV